MHGRPDVFLVLAIGLTFAFSSRLDADDAPFTRTEDVIYRRKFGTVLTMDVLTPTQDVNGAAVVYVISAGWFSTHEVIDTIYLKYMREFLNRGYTVFAVVHGSQPKFDIPEVLLDLHRAVRFIRSRADDYKIDPERIGIYGSSAGGHLSLMQGMAGDRGNPEAEDPIDRRSSRVQAVGSSCPPTDFLNYGKPGENALGRGLLAKYRAPFDFLELDTKLNVLVPVTSEEKRLEIGKRISPVNHVSSDDPPTLIIHGDADKLVPIQQAERIVEKLKAAGVAAELVVKPGAGHDWPDRAKDLPKIADWFDRHLAKK